MTTFRTVMSVYNLWLLLLTVCILKIIVFFLIANKLHQVNIISCFPCQGKSGGPLKAAARCFDEGITHTEEQSCAQ